jgi:hypothetical protein
LTENHHVGVDEPESINDDLSFDALNGIDDDSDSSVGQSLEGLLSVDVHAGQPAAETGMRVVPADNHFRTAGLAEHVQHFGLRKKKR